MDVLWEQVLILLIFVSIGFILGKTKIVGQEQSRVLSTLAVYVFLPCLIFKSFADMDAKYLVAHWKDILVAATILLALIFICHFAGRLFSKNKYEQSVYEYSLTVANFGFVGYALAESMFGAQGLSDVVFYSIPLTIYSYSYAYGMLTKTKFDYKMLLKPALLAIILGLVVGLSRIKIPGMLSEVINGSAACMSPVTMILTGIVISGYPVKTLLGRKSLYIIMALRLIVIPCILGLVVSLVYPSVLIPTLPCYAMPIGMNTILFPRLVGENCEIGAGLVCITTVLSCLTIPLVILLFN